MSRDEEEALLSRARTSLAEAEVLEERRLWAGAVSRGYYAMYQAAQALLARTGDIARTHKGLRIRVQESGLLDREAQALLARAQALREQSDYDATFEPTEGDCRQTVEQSRTFLAAVEAVLTK